MPLCSGGSVQNASRQMLVVRLQDYWGQFVRQLVMFSASGLATTITGNPVKSHYEFSSLAEVNEWILCPENKIPRKPDWHVSEASIGLAKKLRISNSRDIGDALGSMTSPEKEIRIYRNFIVHRNQYTANKIKDQSRSLGYRKSTPHSLPAEFSRGGELVFDRWVRELQLVAKVASK